MKTLQELYIEITSNDELNNAFAEAAKDNKIVEFAKEHGVETSVDEIKTFLEAQAKNEKELSPEELENAAGGTCNGSTRFEVGLSIFGIGIGCAVYAAYSAGACEAMTKKYFRRSIRIIWNICKTESAADEGIGSA